MRHMSEFLVPGFGLPVLLCRGSLPRAWGMAANVRDGNGAFSQHKFYCGCCEMLEIRVCGERQFFFVFSLDRNSDQVLASPRWPDLWQLGAQDVHASFLFGCDLYGHHQKWLVSTTTNRHGLAAFYFTTVSSWNQLSKQLSPCFLSSTVFSSFFQPVGIVRLGSLDW